MNTLQTIDLELSTPVYGGSALGRLPDGRAVFVPFAIPGEVVRVEIVEEKPRYAKARLVEVLKPSPKRITPRCIHFGVCGGCHYQHTLYTSQLDSKTAILADQLTRIGKLVQPPVSPVVASEAWNYRNTVQFHLTANGELGFYTLSGQNVFPVQECHLPIEAINQLWPQLVFEDQPDIERIAIRAGDNEDLQMIFESEAPPPELLVEDLSISVVHTNRSGSLVLAGSEAVWFKVLGFDFRVSAASFFQVNTALAEKMIAYVIDRLPGRDNLAILELYAGVGLFSAFLAPRARRLVAIESAESAGFDFEVNLDAFDQVEFYEAPVEWALDGVDIQPDVVVADPPRAGLARRVVDRLLDLAAPRLIYISCDPATLARDAKQLVQGGYQLVEVTPFDLFPQTYHIESISIWEL